MCHSSRMSNERRSINRCTCNLTHHWFTQLLRERESVQTTNSYFPTVKGPPLTSRSSSSLSLSGRNERRLSVASGAPLTSRVAPPLQSTTRRAAINDIVLPRVPTKPAPSDCAAASRKTGYLHSESQQQNDCPNEKKCFTHHCPYFSSVLSAL